MGTTTAVFVLLAGLGSTPRDEVTVDRVDLVEVNHFYDDQGKLVLDQLIFYDWCSAACRFQVRAWRLLKTPAQLPQREAVDGQYVARWHDGHILRKVYARQFRETWTQFDPELMEREYLPKDKRRDLKKLATTRWHSPPAGGQPTNPAGSTPEPYEFVSTGTAEPRPASARAATGSSGLGAVAPR
ncbi:MAG: hypothetical protein U0935_13315 [Pirellulales bacterium]